MNASKFNSCSLNREGEKQKQIRLRGKCNVDVTMCTFVLASKMFEPDDKRVWKKNDKCFTELDGTSKA